MFYEFDVTTPANTAEADAVRTNMHITQGIIVKGGIQFQAGCNNLVHIRVYVEDHQIWPLNRSGTIKANNIVVPIDEALEIRNGEEVLKCLSHSPNARYSHTVTVRITVLPRLLAYPYLMVQSLVNSLRMALRI